MGPECHDWWYLYICVVRLAVDYMFLANDGADVRTDLFVEPFNAVNEQNDYEVRDCSQRCQNRRNFFFSRSPGPCAIWSQTNELPCFLPKNLASFEMLSMIGLRRPLSSEISRGNFSRSKGSQQLEGARSATVSCRRCRFSLFLFFFLYIIGLGVIDIHHIMDFFFPARIQIISEEWSTTSNARTSTSSTSSLVLYTI